jgi:hypothetical protein
MKRIALSLLFGATLIAVVVAQENSQPKAPLVPFLMNEQERLLLIQSAQLLSQKQFERAEALLRSLALPRVAPVYLDMAAVPSEDQSSYRAAAQQAMEAWNQTLGGALTFQPTDREAEASVRIQFASRVATLEVGASRFVCFHADLDTLPSNSADGSAQRAMRAQIAVKTSNAKKHSPASITHLVGQALGCYLGLSPTEEASDLMGPDTHLPTVPVKPSETDLRRLRQLEQIRAQLMQFAQQRTAVYLPRPTLQVERTDLDAGEVWKGETARYLLKIKNAGDAPLEYVAKPACGCTITTYDRVIAPGSEGQLEAELKTSGFRGKVTKTIALQTNDPDRPNMTVRLTASIRAVVEVLPSSQPLIPLKVGEPTVHEMQIKLQDTKPVEITRVFCGAPYASASVKKVESNEPDTALYTLTLTIQPSAPIGRSAFPVVLSTTSTHEPQSNITVVTEKGIVVLPASVYMGILTAQTHLPLSQIVTLTRRSAPFRILKVEIDDPHLEVQQQTVRPDMEYRLTVIYRGGWTEGSVRRKIIVHTDDAEQPRIEIPLVANVVATTGR